MSKIKKTETIVVAEDKCKADNCKSSQVRFTFCDEHYDWFKFGLINKSGKQVSDFEKKYGHFLSHETKTTHKKVA